MPGRNSTYEYVKARADSLMASRAGYYEDVWQKIADNLFGRRDFQTKRTPGENRKARIYDDTASQMLDLLSGAMHSLLVTPGNSWFSLGFENADLSDSVDAMRWLEQAEKRVQGVFESQGANFHAQIAETFVDMIGFGTGGLFIDDVPGVGVQFSNRPLQELYLTEDAAGRVNSVTRCFELTAKQAVDMFGEEARAAARCCGQNQWEAKHKYIHAIMENEEMDAGKLDFTGMPWASVLLSVEDGKILSEGGYHELPLVTPRWTKEPGEVYGRGCGHNALSNAAGLNEQKKTALIAGQLAVAPPKIVDGESSLPSDLSFAPHAVIVVDTTTTSMNPPIQELQSSARFDVSEYLMSMDQDAVKAAFHWPLLQTLQDARMTATHVLQLSSQQQRHLAPILGRLQTEFLGPIVDRVFAIEARSGRLPEMPPEIIEAGGQNIKVDYKSPLLRAQKGSDAKALIDFLSVIGNLGGVAPDVYDVVNWTASSRELAEMLGVSQTSLNSKAEIKKIREAKNQLAAQQAAQQEEAQAVDNMAKLAKAEPASAAA